MAAEFSPQEILKIAVEIESNGQTLYGNLEKKAGNDRLRAVWKYLKEQEILHHKTFQVMLDSLGEYIVNEFSPGEYKAYLKAVASEYVFTQRLIEAKVKEGFKTDLEAVEFGIFVEKESILTYSALRPYMILAKQATLDGIINEEKQHLVDLVEIKAALKDKEK